MNASIIVTPNFQREAKRLIKKYISLKSEIETLATALEENPTLGTRITENTYKIRLAVKSKGKGKSGGTRVITYLEAKVIENESTTDVYLLSIYDKSERASITDDVLENLISTIRSNAPQPPDENSL